MTLDTLLPVTAKASEVLQEYDDRPIKVLLVEDVAAYADEVKIFFETEAEIAKAKIDVRIEHSAEKAYANLKEAERNKEPFDAVVLDYCLPQTEGTSEKPDLALANFCRTTPDACRQAYQLTSYTDSEDLKSFWESDPLDIEDVLLSKEEPWSLKKLSSMILGQAKASVPGNPPDAVVLAHFRILVVSCDDELHAQTENTLSSFEDHYKVERGVARSLTECIAVVNRRAAVGAAFDAIFIDADVSDITESRELARFCAEQESKSGRVYLLVRPGVKESLPHASDYSILQKSETIVAEVLSGLRFQEIKGPLQSVWLAEYLGKIPTGTWKPRMPKGFSLGLFARRLQKVWPDLDEQTKNKARNLFHISEHGPDSDLPEIGLRQFERKLT
ncbi:hypothetical protein DES53_111168 [Roseimicrobium gellanilyticum]|uniref:Uncharacterized protein n=1 Tax=Roseimicrobium gellanilyticum TaxID=748857 RepID=A0A366H8T9_9BACT|nr:response regulator [Roseimicrobium gellanilyticum]RBP38648.1 hypothetical protein DES53_111168 [Roseimicrobium gellanilyticum]